MEASVLEGWRCRGWLQDRRCRGWLQDPEDNETCTLKEVSCGAAAAFRMWCTAEVRGVGRGRRVPFCTSSSTSETGGAEGGEPVKTKGNKISI